MSRGLSGRWRQRDRDDGSADEVDVAMRLRRPLVVAQVVRPVVLLHCRIARAVNGHHVSDVSAPPGAAPPAVPDGHGTNCRMTIDDIADRGGGRIPAAAIAKERRLAIRPFERGP